jgi:uncharacterized repeat protein (TIGR01451 family)
MTFTITNPNPVAVSNARFSDTLPAGLTLNVLGVPGAGCGSFAESISGGTFSFVTDFLAAGATCVIPTGVSVPNVAKTYTNTTSAITGTGVPDGAAATATLTVVQPAPTFTKAFNPSLIQVGGTSTLTFTITNNAAVAVTGLAFSDTLPAGVVVAAPPFVNNTCGGAVTVTGNLGSISLANGTVNAPSGTTCTISVNVVGTSEGVKNNTTSTLTSTNALTAQPATATLTVVLPPSITKTFADSELQLLGASTALTFAITNPNATTALSGIAFTDTLPAGLVVSTPNGLVGSCGGGAITATDGSTSISLTGATLAGGTTCTFSVNVTGTAVGTFTNTTSPVTAVGGTVVGNTATATVSVDFLYVLWFFLS